MELRQLRYFVAVADERHFARAAKRLHITGPSLSQQITALEHDLHVVLLNRTPRAVTLTPAGEALLGHARDLLTRADRARDAVHTAQHDLQQIRLRIAFGTDDLLSHLLGQLPASAPHLQVTIATCATTDALQAVRDDRADAAIVWALAPDEQDLTQHLLREEPIELALPPGHPYATATAIAISRLADETLILFPRHLSHGVWDRFLHHLLPDGQTRPDQLRIEPDHTNPPQAMLRAVARGRGVTPVRPALQQVAAAAARGDIITRPLLPPLTMPLELIWRAPACPGLQQLIHLLSDMPAATGKQ